MYSPVAASERAPRSATASHCSRRGATSQSHGLCIASNAPASSGSVQEWSDEIVTTGSSRGSLRASPHEPLAGAAASQIMYWPPFALSVEPVMKPASSLARNTTMRAISAGWPSRPTGICARIRAIASFGTAATMSVPI